MAKQAAEEGWTVKATEERVAKVLAKAGKGPRKLPAKPSPSHEYEYNGFHCALVGDEVVIGGRNFKRTRDLVRQFVAEYQVALECFLRDIDAGSAEQPAADTTHPSAEAAPPRDVPTSEVAADLMKQATEVAESLKDIFSEIAKAVGPPGSANKVGNASLSDLLTFFNKPRSSG